MEINSNSIKQLENKRKVLEARRERLKKRTGLTGKNSVKKLMWRFNYIYKRDYSSYPDPGSLKKLVENGVDLYEVYRRLRRLRKEQTTN